MRIIVGHGYDGRLPNTVKPRLNTLTCDGAGLVAELEARAGIVHQPVSSTGRTVAYLNALVAADNPERFYHQSLKTDPVACARELLSWRDNAMMFGWLLEKGTQSNERLADLDQVEQHLPCSSPCLAERIYRLFDYMELICPEITSIEIQGSSNLWPKLFHLLFDRISGYRHQYALEQGVSADSADCKKYVVSLRYVTRWVFGSWPDHPATGEVFIRPKERPAGTDLARFQNAILSQKPLNGFKGDGSVKFYSVTSHSAAAHYLTSELTINSSHLVIAGEKQQELNTALVSAGFAEPGLGERSLWRAPQQLLPSLLGICWAPPSAESVMAYLTLPAGPHRSLRRTIAREFADLPGLNRAKWQECIDAAIPALYTSIIV